MEVLNSRVYNWASEIDELTKHQAFETAKLPIIPDGEHVSLMPDAHYGMGATIGSVIPTKSAIIPSAVGVDIGCGMIAAKTSLVASELPDDLSPILDAIAQGVPAGLGKWHRDAPNAAFRWMEQNRNTRLTPEQEKKATVQFGTLGSGNHFFEVCLDEAEQVWVVMHSGSRGVGNQLASAHIRIAKKISQLEGYEVPDPDLAWLQENTQEFNEYISDMQWAQDYAMANRTHMMDTAVALIFLTLGRGREIDRVNCHHNFAQKEIHNGQEFWITRKGAIKADVGDRGVIPGSMGGKSYIIQGLGNTDSYTSCSHGAGRRMSRKRARKELSLESFAEKMGGAVWQQDKALELLDEHPDSYKDIDVVMSDQKDLVEIVHELKAIVNYKGTS